MKHLPVILSALLFAAALLFFSFSLPEQRANSLQNTVSAPYIPMKVEFAGEALPLQFFDVRESFEREIIVYGNLHSAILQNLKRITRYFPVIEPVLKANGVPDDFKYLALIESDLRNQISPRGATGFWQFMKSAADDYNLEINDEVDERYHLEKSTEAACSYLKRAYSIFGSWTMAAASYNMGIKGLSDQIKRQKCDYYYDLLLSEETMRYVFRIAAVKTILNDAERYGFSVADNEKYAPLSYTEVVVETSVESWADFAFEHGSNYKMLKYFNPWLRDAKLMNKKQKAYIIKIPAQGFREGKHDIGE
ncbi:MAG: lytic transglycosylase domain-containing protein [Prevotellaceae bacterium]|jgi:hypothetical protein|nr:lytic transglycosylase domain-containing protein [Prevotellaceae bacterium]